jgi:hypothetical protein
MKDGVVLFLLCVIAIGAIAGFALYMNRVPRGILGQGIEQNQTAAEPSPAPAPKPLAKSAAKRKVPESAPAAEPGPSASILVPAPESPTASSPAATPAPAPLPPFPSVSEIAVGAVGDAITDAYGDPSLSTTTSDHGHVLETFVYARNGIREMTVISLQDGRVSSAYSKPRSMSAIAVPPPPLRRRGS